MILVGLPSILRCYVSCDFVHLVRLLVSVSNVLAFEKRASETSHFPLWNRSEEHPNVSCQVRAYVYIYMTCQPKNNNWITNRFPVGLEESVPWRHKWDGAALHLIAGIVGRREIPGNFSIQPGYPIGSHTRLPMWVLCWLWRVLLYCQVRQPPPGARLWPLHAGEVWALPGSLPVPSTTEDAGG